MEALEQIIILLATNGVPIVICGVIIYGLWKGLPSLCSWMGQKADMWIDSQIKKDTEIINSVKEIQKNNSTLVKAINKIEDRVDSLEKTTDEILNIVTVTAKG